MPREHLGPGRDHGRAILGMPRRQAGLTRTDASRASRLVPVQPVWHSVTRRCHSPPSSQLQLGVDGLSPGRGLGTVPPKGTQHARRWAVARWAATVEQQFLILIGEEGGRLGGEELEINVSSFLK